MPIALAEVRDAPVDAPELSALVARPDAGAVVADQRHDPVVGGLAHPSKPMRGGR